MGRQGWHSIPEPRSALPSHFTVFKSTHINISPVLLQGDTKSFTLIIVCLHNVFCLFKIIIIIVSSGNLCAEALNKQKAKSKSKSLTDPQGESSLTMNVLESERGCRLWRPGSGKWWDPLTLCCPFAPPLCPLCPGCEMTATGNSGPPGVEAD